MTRDELKKLIYSHTAHSNDFEVIMDAVDAYSSASNDGKPFVSGSLTIFEQFVVSDEKVNGRQTEFIEDPAGGSENYFSWSVIERWFRRQ